MTELRRATVWLDSETLARLLGIPGAVSVRGVAANPLTETVAVVLEGESLPVCYPGAEPPPVPVTVTSSVIEPGWVSVHLDWAALPHAVQSR